MYLRGLRLRGFKSFADPVELQFERGVAVIVGPNGSGKSNVAEALQWAMASLPPSELRMESASDVLFAGAERRGPVAVCEVELVLANEDGRLSGPDLDRPEVSVMRRLTRAGDSSYLLNRRPVRRLDVQEALADAGLGRELHAIVSQGRVESILLSRPADRRGFIEEAAGLGKYKRRRHRARGKLERVELNLERARDLDRELAGRVRPLALQASAAERAAELRARIGEAQVELLGSQIAGARQRRHELDRRLATERAETARLDAEIGTAGGERADAELELSGLAARQEAASAAFYALDGALDRLRQRADALAERAEALAADERRARIDSERWDVQAAASAAAATAAAGEADRYAGEVDALHAGEGEDRLRALVLRARSALDASLAARRERAELDGGHARAAAELAAARERYEHQERHGAALVESARGGSEAQARADAAAAEAEAAAREVRLRQAGATASLRAAEVVLEAARDEERAHRLARATAAERAAAARSRHEAALAAVRRGDGLTPAVRGLRDAGVRLLLDDLEITAGRELAVSGALGWRAAEALAPLASEAVALLADERLAGAALACLDRLGPRAAPEVGRPLLEVVRAGGAAIPAGLLDGVHLVEDPDDLLRATRGVVVAPDGRGFDADRGIAFRADDGRAVALAVRRDASTAEAETATALAELEDVESALAAATGRLEAAAAAEQVARDAATAAGQVTERAERTVRDAVRSADQAARAAERTREQEAVARAELARLAERILELEREAAGLAEAAGAASTRSTALAAEYERVDAERAEAQAGVAELRGRRAAVEERLARARDDAGRHATERDAAAAAARAARDRASRLGAMASRLPRVADAAGLAREAAATWLRPAREGRDALERRARELTDGLRAAAERETALQRRAREVQGRVTTAEVERATNEERLGELVRRRREIVEEVGVDVVDRVEPRPDDEVAVLAATIERLERRLLQIGPVNPLAQEEYEQAKERAEESAEQIRDLEGSLRELRKLIRELTATISARFDEAFGEVEAGFRDVVEMLFPGGRGRLRLVDPLQHPIPGTEDGETGGDADADLGADEGPPEDVEPGVELEVSPAGKEISQLSLLSGGEKALAAIAFLFAIMLARPCPFYVLDEVDAALDDVNVERFLRVVDRLRDRAQFIVITHQKRTMEAADALYGVTMAGDGVSQVVSRRLPRAAPAT